MFVKIRCCLHLFALTLVQRTAKLNEGQFRNIPRARDTTTHLDPDEEEGGRKRTGNMGLRSARRKGRKGGEDHETCAGGGGQAEGIQIRRLTVFAYTSLILSFFVGFL